MDNRIVLPAQMALFQNRNRPHDGEAFPDPVLYDKRICEKNKGKVSGINRRYFDGLLADRQLSLRALAARMGMNHSQLSLTFSGTRRAQIDEAVQLADILGAPLLQVIEALGVALPVAAGRRVAVVGAVAGDGTVAPQGPGVVERVSAPGELPPDCVALQYRTAGTTLDWLDGAVAFCRSRNGIEPGALGRLCWAGVKGGPQVVATIRRGYQENTFNLSGPCARESVVLQWASPILVTRN